LAKTLAVAIERENWELAALCLLVGVVEAAEKLPPESIEALIEILAGPESHPGTRRRRSAGRRHERRR
jgi:hypothetical protein